MSHAGSVPASGATNGSTVGASRMPPYGAAVVLARLLQIVSPKRGLAAAVRKLVMPVLWVALLRPDAAGPDGTP